MKLLDRIRHWRQVRRLRAHREWLRRNKVSLPKPNPRAIVYSKWRVPR